MHEGVMWACMQCDYRAKAQSSLNHHVGSKHGSLLKNIQSKHEGAMWACEKCNYQTTQEWILRRHRKNKHKVISEC